jgi:hypothetical protein
MREPQRRWSSEFSARIHGGGAQKFGKCPYGRKKLFSPANPLKILKTAKEIFAKIWRKQAKIF